MAELGTSPVLRVENVSKDYGETVITSVLRDVDLEVQHGEFVALVGPSGSGKSTLLNLVGLLDRPTRGRIWIGDQDTSGLDDEELTALRGSTLGFVFQFHHLLPAFTALENVMLPGWAARGRPSEALRQHAHALLDSVGLADLAERRATQLSGGQQQRVAIARALIADPRLLVADEPTGNLDTASSAEVFDLLEQVNRTRGTTLLVVTHDPRIAARARRVTELVDGRVVKDGPPPPPAR
jgi:lipoprotein-releasing system ATP-binding protein